MDLGKTSREDQSSRADFKILPALSSAVRRGSDPGRKGILPIWVTTHGLQLQCTPGRRTPHFWNSRFRNDFHDPLQFTLCVLPEFPHQPNGRWAGKKRGVFGENDARLAEPGLPQHQLGNAYPFCSPDPGSALLGNSKRISATLSL
jgi:hypothetical protein